MKSANDHFSAEAELMGMLCMARFLLASLDRYEREPDGEKWQSIHLAREWLAVCCERVEPFRESFVGDLREASQ